MIRAKYSALFKTCIFGDANYKEGVGMITFLILIFQRTSMKQKKMREIASRDGLTQLYNKAGTEQRIKEWLHSDRSKAGAVLMMMNVDYFKQINDTYWSCSRRQSFI